MFVNHVRMAVRSLQRNRGLAFINIAGLAVGMAACLLILLYVTDELGYDRFHEHADQIYRVTEQEFDDQGTRGVHRVLIDPPIAPLLEAEIPEFAAVARLTPVGPLLSNGDRHVDSGNCYWTDPEIFDIFTIPLRSGEAGTALSAPFSLVISATKSAALFGSENPVGKTVIVNNKDPFTVTGVFDDLPSNTHLPIDVLGSIATLESWFGSLDWGSPNYATYARLADGAAAGNVTPKIADVLLRHRGEDLARRSELLLQPMRDIHLKSHLVGELAPNGDIRYIYLFATIALFILVIACINFMNLATARSTRRAKEVGMRKAIGATRAELIGQFLTESTLLTFVSLSFSLLLVFLFLPYFNDLSGKRLTMFGDGVATQLTLLVALGVIVGVAAGSYPAFFLSSFRPAAVLKGRTLGAQRGSGFRSALVVAQFVIAIVLLISTIAVRRQLSFINQQELGFEKEQLLVLPTVWDLREDFDPFRQQLLAHPDVVQVAQSNPIPSRQLSLTVEAMSQGEAAQARSTTLYPVFADNHFFPTYGIGFLAGRNFSDEFASDADTGFILNETAATALGWSDPATAVNAPLRVGGWQGNVIGVVNDFHLESLHQKIAPMVFYMDPRNFRFVSIKIRPGAALPGVISFLENQWQRHEPNSPLVYSFLDERFGEVYAAEQNLGRIVGTFAGLAIIITCLGLFGMATFAVEQRTKEIGIRKVLGASVPGIVLLFSRDFAKLFAIAVVAAAAIAFFVLGRWLATYAYHAALSWWIFALAGCITIAIAALAVGFQTIRAAVADPVKSLRYE
jgi:putative ABC transport system permease protein